MGAMQRRKGKAGELELARLLREHLGADVARNLEQTRQGGADLLGIDGGSRSEARGPAPAVGVVVADVHAGGSNRAATGAVLPP